MLQLMENSLVTERIFKPSPLPCSAAVFPGTPTCRLDRSTFLRGLLGVLVHWFSSWKSSSSNSQRRGKPCQSLACSSSASCEKPVCPSRQASRPCTLPTLGASTSRTSPACPKWQIDVALNSPPHACRHRLTNEALRANDTRTRRGLRREAKTTPCGWSHCHPPSEMFRISSPW
jgi:hypothetical protein